MTDTKKPEYDMAEEVRSFNILMEEIRDTVKLVAEGVVGLGEQMDRRFKEQDVKFSVRFDDLEAAVRLNGKDIQVLQQDVGGLKQDVSGLKQDVSGLKQDVSGLKQDVSGLKQDVSGLRGDVGSLKQDLAGLHTKFDRLEKRTDRHGDDIVMLKSVVGIQS